MVVFAIRPVSAVTRTVRAVRSDKPDEVETAAEPAARVVPAKPKPAKREGKAFYQSAVTRSSGGVQAALIGLQRGG